MESYDESVHDTLAARAARESAVLLKLGTALPASKTAKIGVVGAFAKAPRYQGAGSSKINPNHVTSLCSALDARGIPYTWATGYEAEQTEADEALIAQAVEAMAHTDVVFACVGLPDSYESEGFDRVHMDLPEAQNALMDALTAAGKPVVAVVSTGSAIVMPWQNKVDSILLLYLTGQNGGSAAAELLFGDANPCGKLAETWPESMSDCPCGGNFGHGGNVEYRESIYVGYRYYDKAEKAVAYPFGHGLSYTTFAYSGLTLSPLECSDLEDVEVSCTVTNTGNLPGAEVAQLYVAPPESAAFKPVRELRDYQKVFLKPGESKTVIFHLDRRAFSYYNPNISDWFVESGEYQIEVGSSSRDIRLSSPLFVRSAQEGQAPDFRETAPAYYDLRGGIDVPKEQFEALLGGPVTPWPPVRPFTRNSTLGDLVTCEMGRMVVEQIKQGLQAAFGGSGLEDMMTAMLQEMPLRELAMMDPVHFSAEKIDTLLTQLNAES